ncbi:MAG: hypothetical protein AB7O97_20875 [Planctomycetota bacterium]
MTPARRAASHAIRSAAALRLAVALLVVTFALPSCVTRWMWTDYRIREGASLATELARAEADDAPFPLAIATGPWTAQLAARCTAPPPDAAWLLLEPVDRHKVRWFTSDRPLTTPTEQLEVRVLADPSDGPTLRCFLCRAPTGANAPARRLTLASVSRPDLTEHLELALACRATLVADPPPGALRQPAVLVLMEKEYSGSMSTLGRVLLTPLTVAWDVAWSPLELVTLPIWW